MSPDEPAPPAHPPRSWDGASYALFVLGVIASAACWYWADRSRVQQGCLVSFLFFAPLAAGMVVWSAVAMVSNGRWMGRSERWALAGCDFIGISPALLIPYVGVRAGSYPIAAPRPDQATWLNPELVFYRDVAALMILWGLASWYAHRRRAGRPTVLAGVLIFAYCVVFSLIAFDMVMALDPHWYSALFGGYFFISGLYAAVAAWSPRANATTSIPSPTCGTS